MTHPTHSAGEMIERVARAICEADGEDPDAVKAISALRILRGGYDTWGGYLDDARVAIAAMREPTEAMIEASNREWDGRMSHRSSGAWQAMIDAALTQPEVNAHE